MALLDVDIYTMGIALIKKAVKYDKIMKDSFRG